MAKTTAPILLIGGIGIFTDTLIMGHNLDFKRVVATGFAAAAFAALELVNQPFAVGLAWIALITSLLMPKRTLLGMEFTSIDDLRYLVETVWPRTEGN